MKKLLLALVAAPCLLQKHCRSAGRQPANRAARGSLQDFYNLSHSNYIGSKGMSGKAESANFGDFSGGSSQQWSTMPACEISATYSNSIAGLT